MGDVTVERGRLHTPGQHAADCLPHDDRRNPLHVDSVRLPEASETVARRIADAGAGLSPVSKLREAIYETALREIRALRGRRDGAA